jgi:acetolactate synthase-1/2/3 large subunit
MGAREVMEEVVPPAATDPADFAPVEPCALPSQAVEALLADLLAARRPLVVTSYLGRNTRAVEQLRRLVGALGIGVLDSVPNAVNLPHDDPMHQGCQWNEPRQNPALAEADLVLVIDSDVPWIPTVSRPREGVRIWHLDVDPLKQQMPLWSIPARRVFRAHGETALAQLNDALARLAPEAGMVAERRGFWAARHAERRAALAALEVPGPDDAITPEYLTAQVRAVMDERSLVLNEGITNYPVICNHIAPTRAGQMLNSGGGNLGWAGGAAIGARLADPSRSVISLLGDGCYLFSQPSTVHWMARRYGTPFLQVIYNNRGWKAPRFSTLAVHGSGYAAAAEDIGVAFDPPPDHAAIAAAAGGAFARKVERASELPAALQAAMHSVRSEGRAAVLDIWLPHLMA